MTEDEMTHIRSLRTMAITAAVGCGVAFLFFSTVTMLAPEWVMLLLNVIPLLGMGFFAVAAIRLHWSVKQSEE